MGHLLKDEETDAQSDSLIPCGEGAQQAWSTPHSPTVPPFALCAALGK